MGDLGRLITDVCGVQKETGSPGETLFITTLCLAILILTSEKPLTVIITIQMEYLEGTRILRHRSEINPLLATPPRVRSADSASLRPFPNSNKPDLPSILARIGFLEGATRTCLKASRILHNTMYPGVLNHFLSSKIRQSWR